MIINYPVSPSNFLDSPEYWFETVRDHYADVIESELENIQISEMLIDIDDRSEDNIYTMEFSIDYINDEQKEEDVKDFLDRYKNKYNEEDNRFKIQNYSLEGKYGDSLTIEIKDTTPDNVIIDYDLEFFVEDFILNVQSDLSKVVSDVTFNFVEIF